MRVLVLGADGQLGTDLLAAARGPQVLAHRRADADVTDVAKITRFIEAARPQWVINTTAYNRTEDAEKHRDLAFAVNAQGALNAAHAATLAGARLIHVGSDFVFDGKKAGPYVESDEPHPLSVYGDSKREGERLVLAENPAHLVVRTASLFGRAGSRAKGGNIVETILAKARARQPLRFVDNIRMSPTYARDLAEKIWELVAKGAPGGFYHLANAGAATWKEFAQAVVDLDGIPVRVEGMPAPATGIRRAANSVLVSERLKPLGIEPMRPWREALSAYLADQPPRPPAP